MTGAVIVALIKSFGPLFETFLPRSSTSRGDSPAITALRGRRSYSRILSKSCRRLIPSRSAVLVRLPLQAARARAIARRSTSARIARRGTGSPESRSRALGVRRGDGLVPCGECSRRGVSRFVP